MEDSKTLWLYLVGLAGLIVVSILFTGRVESLEIEPQPPPATQVKSTASLLEAKRKSCSSTAPQMSAGYLADLAHLDRDRLIISGTVYASDFVTPLPGVQIKARRAPSQSQDDPRFPPFYALQSTNEAGHFEFIIYKPSEIGQLDYELSYQNICLVTLHLVFINEPAPDNASPVSNPTASVILMKQEVKPANLTNVLLRSPVDIVLPVPPPAP